MLFKNRFENCSDLNDLRDVMINSKLTFRALSKQEIDSINLLLAQAIELPEVRVRTESDFNKLQKAFNKEEEIMSEEIKVTKVTLKEAITNNDGSLNQEAIKNFIDETAKEVANAGNGVSEDDNINAEKVKARLVSITELLGIVGLTKLKSDIERVFYSGLNEKGNLNPDNMMETIIGLCQEEQKRLEYWSTNKTIVQSFTLKAITSEDNYGNKNIFQAINSALLNIVNRVTNSIVSKYEKLEQNAKSIVVKAMLKGFRELFGALIGGVKFAIELIGCTIALALCSVTAVGYWIFNTVRKIFKKLKEHIANKPAEEIHEDDFLETTESSETVVI